MPEITIRLPKFLSFGHRVFDLRSGLSGSPRADILSGLTVALALVPEAVAFSFLAGVPPLVGLYAAFIICLLTSILGGRPGMISGATGAMGVVVVALVADHGIGYLFPAVVLCGLIQITAGIFRLGKFIRIVPHPVMLGFVNGLAVVILIAQFGSFKTLDANGAMAFLSGSRLWIMLGLVALTMAIIAFLPRITKVVPSSLAAILLVSIAAFAINASADDDDRPLLTVREMLVDSTLAAAVVDAQHTKDVSLLEATVFTLPDGVIATPAHAGPITPLTAEETAAAIASVDVSSVGIAGGLPRPAWWDFTLPPATLETLWIILPFALILAGVGLIESLMTLTLIDELTTATASASGRGSQTSPAAYSAAWVGAR